MTPTAALPAGRGFDRTPRYEIPKPLIAAGTLHLRFRVQQSFRKILTFLRASNLQFTGSGDLISIRVPTGSLVGILDPLVAVLSPREQAEVRTIFEPEGKPIGLSECFETGSLARFSARQQARWLIDIIRTNRLTSFFQPIVGATNGGIFGYECLLRAMDEGQLIACSRMLRIAEGAGLLYQIDQAARCSALREAARFRIRTKIFINYLPATIDDPLKGLRETLRLLDELEIERRQVVFEIVETDRIVELDDLERILAQYRKLGFEVALDDVGAGYSSLNLLQRLRPDYLKLDVQLIRGVDQDSYKAVLTAKLLEASEAIGVKTIAEGVEHPGECRWLQIHGADYLQGYYFARPASPPPAVARAS